MKAIKNTKAKHFISLVQYRYTTLSLLEAFGKVYLRFVYRKDLIIVDLIMFSGLFRVWLFGLTYLRDCYPSFSDILLFAP